MENERSFISLSHSRTGTHTPEKKENKKAIYADSNNLFKRKTVSCFHLIFFRLFFIFNLNPLTHTTTSWISARFAFCVRHHLTEIIIIILLLLMLLILDFCLKC